MMVKADITEDMELSMLDEKRIGMVRVLWLLASEIKLTEALKEAFPKTWRAILSVAFYYVSSGRNAAYLFPSWAEDHESPILEKDLKDADISLLFSGMEEARRKEFLKVWRDAAASGKACFNDITSISSYSRENEMMEFGYNRDHEDLPQVNLGLIVDSGSRLPLYYHVHDGSIHDVSTLEHVMREGFAFNMHNLMFVMDKGFYSRQNVSLMYSNRYGFIIAMTLSSGTAKNAIDSEEHNHDRQWRSHICEDDRFALGKRELSLALPLSCIHIRERGHREKGHKAGHQAPGVFPGAECRRMG